MSEHRESWFAYDFAVLQLVPRVHRSECYNIGVILYAPTSKFLAGRFLEEDQALKTCALRHGIDLHRVTRYLQVIDRIICGDQDGGPIAQLPLSERFHWLSAPRSDILQPTSIHPGRCRELEGCVDELFAQFVL